MKTKLILSSIVLSTSLSFAFDFKNFAKEMINENVNKETSSKQEKEINSSLSDTTISKGLKEALNIGVKYAIENLSKENGYLTNAKIELPNNLDKAESLIRKAGGEKYADELIKSMNDAATKAAPKTIDIFTNAIKDMNIDDAKKILAGDKNAATNYFKSSSFSKLKETISPIVKESIKDSSVASYYNKFNSFYQETGKDYVGSSSLMGYAKNFGVDKYIPNSDPRSLDDYITDSAINGLFSMIAKKETDIRDNQSSQTTSILKEVFAK